MKKCLIFIGGVIAIIVVVDVLFGLGARYYMSRSKLPGDCRPIDYVIRESNEDILILGSSVSLNSLMPSVIEDSLGMSCFNGGANGQHTPFIHTLLDCVLKRHSPKVIIFGIQLSSLTEDGIGRRFNILAPYYKTGYHFLDSCFESGDKSSKLLLKSNLIRYNTIWWRILLYHFMSSDVKNEKGYVAKGIPPYPPTMIESDYSKGFDISDVMQKDLEQMFSMCKQRNIKTILYFPPQYCKMISAEKLTAIVDNICKKYDVTFIDDSQDEYFLQHPEYFYDNSHLNDEGAHVYTNLFISKVRDIIGATSGSDSQSTNE